VQWAEGWHLSLRALQACAASTLLCSLLCCSLTEKTKLIGATQHDPVDPIRSADLGAHFPAATSPTGENSSQSFQPLLFPGAATEPAPPRGTTDQGYREVSADAGVVVTGGGVEFNFDNADIQHVAKTVLGDTLGMSFAVDPRVQGNVSLASTGPVRRNDVLPVFESVLRMSNAAIVHEGNLVKIVPIAEASGTGVSLNNAQGGFGVSVVPLRYTAASTVARTADNFLTRPGAIKIDQARNLLLIQGTTAERQAALDVVAAFDVEWMRNQSVGIFPLKSTSPETMIRELERLFESSEDGRGQGLVRFQPVSRMNAVLMVTRNPKFLEQATRWVQRLDRSDTSGTTVRVYRLKYGNAPHVAKILNQIFVASRSASGEAPTSQIAPGTSAVQSRLDSLRTASAGGTAGTTGGAATTPPAAAPSSRTSATSEAGRIAAAFESFDHKDGDVDLTTNASGVGSGDGQTHGIFQNVRITADPADNAVVVYSNAEDYRVIERALREIDQPKLQVAIEATIAEVTLTDALQFGVQYFFSNLGNGNSVGLSSAPAAPVNGVDATAVVQATVAPFLQQVLPGFNLLLGPQAQPRVILSALSNLTTVKVLSAPSVVAMDDRPALLQVGDEIPISTGTATILSNANNPVVSTIEMRNTGVILKVLPHVYANGTIQMEIEQEISNVVNPNQPTLTPTISQRRVHSTIAVTSGQTVLLGGLISDQNQKTKSGIPALSDIDFIGNLFGTRSAQKQRTEIIMFIKPRLIRNGLDARSVAEEFRSSLEMMRKPRPFAADPVAPVGK
jgi:general secretion pathway protein D